jgi:NO-binding membrane sensor protein with MHYT domain
VANVDFFSYGWLTPAFAYFFSFLGCLLGLFATARARMLTSGARRARWLVLAAWSIGGTGIWVMHFIAMIGVEVNGAQVYFDLPTTIASWLTAIIVVGVGLFIVGYGRSSTPKLLLGGLFTGLGVAAMHYTGMGAMRVDGDMSYSSRLVILSVVIAVVAATVALWFTLHVRRAAGFITAGAIMAVAVCGMHYTGMVALRVHLHAVAAPVTGVQPLSLIVPIFIFVLIVVVALGYAMLNSLSLQDRDALSDLQARLGGGAASIEDVTAGFRVNRRHF